jgi:hypothetical protein
MATFEQLCGNGAGSRQTAARGGVGHRPDLRITRELCSPIMEVRDQRLADR